MGSAFTPSVGQVTPGPMFGDFNVAHLVVWYLVFVFSTTFHEYAHAYLAFRGGDLTAYEGGVLSLDPLPHIQRSPVGMVIVPLISYIQLSWMIGWASVPFDPYWGRRYPRRQAVMSLAGPCANFLLAVLGIVALRVLLATDVFFPPHRPSFTQLVVLEPGADVRSIWAALAMLLSVLVNLNVLLGLFNLIPVPPLDGAGVVEGFASRKVAEFYQKLRETPLFQLAGLIVAWQLFAFVVGPAFSLVLALVHPDVTYR
ncbi:MAG TPA: site-2 protease family protein [Polyangiaceae bacterium]|nr:site-2 protease family protein [Polyangiaceae bacterium]